jgi:transcriptional regulator with XRE-family HTH domain
MPGMNRERLGNNLQKRARELGLSDAEVARRLGLGQSRYANYVSGTREPDFATFTRICQVLQITPDQLLEFCNWPQVGSESETLIQRLQAVLKVLNLTSLRTAVMMLEALAANQSDEEKPTG